MKVALIPSTHNYNTKYPSFLSFSDFPTGFGYLASSLKEAGHKVIGFNPNNITGYRDSQVMLQTELGKFLKENKVDLIGLGGLCTDYAFLHDAIYIIRENTKTPIVLGGNIMTLDAEFIMDSLKPDYGVIGEGEEVLVRLANRESPDTIPNLYHRNGDGTHFTPTDFDYRALDERPVPDYEPFGIQNMIDNYSGATRLLYSYCNPYPRLYTIVTARGCPFKCSFCVHDRGPKYRARSIASIYSEIKEAYEKYKFNILLIDDELFAVNKERMNEFSYAIIAGKESHGWDFKWTFQTHASAALDIESLKLAKKAGCFFFSYGLESASPTVLESMNKKTTVPQIIEAIGLAKEAGLGFGGNLIFGDPAETDETIQESLSFWLKYCKGAFVFLGFVIPYPGSKIFNECIEKGIIKDKKEYYENVDRSTYNMTSMSEADIKHRFKAVSFLEKSWLLASSVEASSCEVDTKATEEKLIPFLGQMHKIKANCPYCGEEVMYRQMYTSVDKGAWTGTGCPNCNQKFRIDIKR